MTASSTGTTGPTSVPLFVFVFFVVLFRPAGLFFLLVLLLCIVSVVLLVLAALLLPFVLLVFLILLWLFLLMFLLLLLLLLLFLFAFLFVFLFLFLFLLLSSRPLIKDCPFDRNVNQETKTSRKCIMHISFQRQEWRQQR